MQLILASQSPYRKAQLTQLGVQFEAVKPDVDESALKAQGPTNLRELTRYLAFQKANSLREKFPDAILLGSDQIAELEGRRLDKPGTREGAIAQLEALQGRKHVLLTSLVVSAPTLVQTFTDVTHLAMRALTRAEIEAYVDLDQPLDCAGSYKIERAGMALLKSIETHDPSAIQGLPLLSLAQGFHKLGLSWTELWRKS